MAGILDRFASIIKANINDLLDKAEDPAKMVDQYLRDLTEDLAEVKESASQVIAEETRTKRLVDENKDEVDRFENLAKKALSAGNEEDARTFLRRKQALEDKGDGLEEAYKAASSNADKMRQMHDKLVGDIETLRQRREVIQAKTAVAKTQKKVNELTYDSSRAEGALAAFDRMEEKADRMLDSSNALSELNTKPTDDTEELASKYDSESIDRDVDEELANLKKEMGIG